MIAKKSINIRKNPVVYLLLLLLASSATYFGVDFGSEQANSRVEASNTLEQAFKNQQSKVWVNVSGNVTRILPDDNEGSRHQRFILKLSSGHTVLVAHNIDLADRVPLKKADNIVLRGRYEWNEKGGVVHWTHHDPNGKLAGGWIEHKSKTYQ